MLYRFVDCRWDIADPARGRELYLAGHIPGAAFLDVDAELAAAPGARGRHPLPDAGDFAAAASRAGIGPDVFVVAYGNMGGAERLWWLLRHFGHDACAVIELDAWHGPLRAGEEEIAPAEFVPRPRSDDTIEADELAARLDELVVVDARVPERWRGEPNPIDRVPGRVPGALNAPWNEPLPAAAGRRPRRVLRLGRHGVRDVAPARPRRPRGQALSRIVVRVGAAPRASGRARLGKREDDADRGGDRGRAGLDRSGDIGRLRGERVVRDRPRAHVLLARPRGSRRASGRPRGRAWSP